MSRLNFEICLASGEFSDFTVRCGSDAWKVHRVIVCSQSKWFQAACTGDFQVFCMKQYRWPCLF